jgi:hypothetical protein
MRRKKLKTADLLSLLGSVVMQTSDSLEDEGDRVYLGTEGRETNWEGCRCAACSPSSTSYYGDGMSLRDAFAIGAVSGYLASMNPGSIDQRMAEHIARNAYDVADAMLAARQGQGGGS